MIEDDDGSETRLIPWRQAAVSAVPLEDEPLALRPAWGRQQVYVPAEPEGPVHEEPRADELQDEAPARRARRGRRPAAAAGEAPAENAAEQRAAAPATASVARSSLGMAFWTLFSRVLGVVRNALTATAVGLVGAPADAWNVANTIPNIIFLLLAGGVLNAVFVPALTKAAKDKDGGQAYSDRLITLTMVVLLGVSVVATAAAPLLVWLFAGEMPSDGRHLAVCFAFICLPQIFFYGLYSVLGQVLNARGRFQEFMAATVVANVVAIAGLGLFLLAFESRPPVDRWDTGMILVLAGSATLSVIVQAVVLVPPLLRDGFRYRPRFDFRGAGLASASRAAVWIFVALMISQVGQLLATRATTSVHAGDVAGNAVFGQASQLFMLPHSLIALSIMTATFPAMSRAAASRDFMALRDQLDRGMRMIVAFGLPATSVMLLLALPMTAVLYPGNDPHSTGLVALVMAPMVCVLMPYGLMQLVHRVYYALDDARGAVRIQVWITAVQCLTVLVAMLMPDRWVTFGVALAQALGHSVGTVVSLRMVQGRLRYFDFRGVARTSVRAGLAVLAAAVPTWVVAWVIGHLLGAGLVSDVVELLVCGLLFLACYLAAALLLGVREVAEVAQPLLRRLARR